MLIALIVIIAVVIIFLIAARVFNFDLREITEFINDMKGLVITGIIAIIVLTFIVTFQPIAGNSMHPTIEEGQVVLVNKLAYVFSDIGRNQIVSLKNSENRSFIKRVVGLPGEKIDFRDNIFYINDIAHSQPYIADSVQTYDFRFDDICGLDECPEGVIPPNMYLVLGDNRPHSEDSRAEGFGLIPKEQIRGKVVFRIWPINKVGRV